MTTTATYDFKKLRPLLDSAGISVEEASHLFKASKVTLYSWCEGNAPNQALLLQNAERLVKLIERAVAAKSLPLVDVDKPDRLKALFAALRNHIQ